MKNLILSIAMLLCFCSNFFLFGQDTTNVYNSRHLVDAGIKYHDNGEFTKAIEKYDKVNRNDSAWFDAQIEKTLSLLEDKKYDECINVAREALKYPFDRHPFIYLHLAIALDETGKTEESITVLDEGISIFPGNYKLNYSKGIILQKKGDLEAAVKSYQTALLKNPFHANSHLKLGYLCANRGYYAQAVMSLAGYIMVSNNDSTKLQVLSYLDKYLSEKNTFDEPVVEGLYEKDFSNVDLIIGNQVALLKKYKLKSKLDFPVVRQIQALVENLKYNENSKGFWMQYYVPFYSRIVEEDQLDGFSNLIMSAATNDKVVKVVKKHAKDVKDFSSWANSAWLKPYQMVDIPFDKVKSGLKRVHRDGSRIYGISDCTDEKKKTGDWVFIDEDGGLLSLGSFNQEGERNGRWTFHHDNGKVSSIVDYSNGQAEGKLIEYDVFGYKRREAQLENNLLNGYDVRFFRSGDTSSLNFYKEGSIEGNGFSRFNNGQTELQANYVKGKYDGLVKRFYDNGQVEVEVEFKDGLKNGYFKSYHRNGKLKQSETYTFDKSNGAYKDYYNNGQIKTEATTIDDKFKGLYKLWSKNGVLLEQGEYNDKGKMQGLWETYSKDGALHEKANYKNGAIISYECFDKNGKSLYKAEQKQGKLKYKDYYPEGGIKTEGDFVNGERQGKWIYYHRYGYIEQEEYYVEGKCEGKNTEYFHNGKADKIFNYSKGSREGLYEEFYIDGSKYQEGLFSNDKRAAEWTIFQTDSVILGSYYYLNGSFDGWVSYNNILGVPWKKVFYNDGEIVREQLFDTLGVLKDDIELKGNSGFMNVNWPNGKIRNSIEMKNGYMNGHSSWHFINGKTDVEGKMFNGDRQGEWKFYFYTGAKHFVGSYDNGNKTGLWKEYSIDGIIYSESNFVDDELDGKYIDYSFTGKPAFEGIYAEGKEEGRFNYYSPDGDLAYVLEFIEGAIVAYSYNGTDGKLKPFVPVKNGTFLLEAYFANGQKSVNGQFEKGLKTGKWVWYYSNGKTEVETAYVNGRRDGKRSVYYNTGKVRIIDFIVNRNLEGLRKEFYPNGNIKFELNYLRDELHGWSKYYNEQGKLINSRYFYSGDLYIENTTL